jgi:hypothetical protein
VKSLLFLALLSFVAPSVASAEIVDAPINSTIIFEAVDGVAMQGRTIVIEGLIQGEAEPRELRFSAPPTPSSGVESPLSERCYKSALIAQDKPGRYTLELRTDQVSRMIQFCKLKRR